MTEQVVQKPEAKKNVFRSWLKRIYGTPASVTVIEGAWKTGKTDFALFLAERLKEYGVINRIASNVQCFKTKRRKETDDSRVLYIDNFVEQRMWMFTRYRKVFIYDEAIKSSPSRRAMSRMNTEWQKVVPELSKGRMHLIVITQLEEITEKTFLHRVFKRAHWKKVQLAKTHSQFRKMVKLRSVYSPYTITFRSLPPTSIPFDPYRSATWKMEPDIDALSGIPFEIQILFEFCDGTSSDALVKKYEQFRYRYEVLRTVRKGGQMLKDKYQVSSVKRRINSHTE